MSQPDLTEPKPQGYVGRFAPSPTGPLHLGSLLVALASYLDARACDGEWLVRIEDIDQGRCDAQYNAAILRTLEKFGLVWDRKVWLQSDRHSVYEGFFEQLQNSGKTYFCECNRKGLSQYNSVYPGICRNKHLTSSFDCAVRARLRPEPVIIHDQTYGESRYDYEKDIGDIVIRRKDHQFSYHFVVVVDDAMQGVTHVLRGWDLMSSTPRQVALQKLLDVFTPQYQHIPILVDGEGKKLSKQHHARPVDELSTHSTLVNLLGVLGLPAIKHTDFESVEDTMQWAVAEWHTAVIPKCQHIKVAYDSNECLVNV